ncbi:hypothetical protein [Flavobacterium sp. ABG]|jgi:hypothetical protein|uniref:hypothetical protein n=1 Tax=Flavobacterium sp. ABG TaxID=1423322 RepID=UPI000649E680|nr:hypothetical protein [Flavobacterium sp. ABG]KLT70908.1 hypothetical protein AB674_03700 [Flavobacterium sp. ABG]
MKHIVGLFFLISFGAFAQKIRPFVGASAYIHTDFNKSIFGDIKMGAEYKVFYYFMPEMEINFTYGALEEVVNRNETGLVMSEYSKRAAAVNYSFCPKVILGNKNGDGSGYIQILPKLTYSNIQATGHAFTRNPNNLSQPIEKKQKTYENQYSFGFGVGYVVDLSDDSAQSLALNIYLNNVDLGRALNKLDQDNRFNTQGVIGLGVNYYFSFKKKTI